MRGNGFSRQFSNRKRLFVEDTTEVVSPAWLPLEKISFH